MNRSVTRLSNSVRPVALVSAAKVTSVSILVVVVGSDMTLRNYGTAAAGYYPAASAVAGMFSLALFAPRGGQWVSLPAAFKRTRQKRIARRADSTDTRS